MLKNALRVVIAAVAFTTLLWGQSGERVIFSFNGSNGLLPDSGLVADSHGNLYGTTFDGGSAGLGNVYMLTPTAAGAWSETVLHTFTGPDGALPEASLTLDAAGNVYGTAQAGGQGQCVQSGTQWLGCGVVFELSHTSSGWQETILYTFQPGVDKGVIPLGGVIFDQAGNLYGTTWAPGVEGDRLSLRAGKNLGNNTFWGCTLPGCGGTVYKLTHTQSGWQETDLYAFTGGSDGSSSEANLIMDSAGNLYGTTTYGGDTHCQYGCGLVFELSQGSGGWTETILHSFTGHPDGFAPTGTLARDAAGNFYSTTSEGGANGHGAVFQLTPAGQQWNENVIYSFTGGLDGALPFAGVVLDSHGNVYGTASSAGLHQAGTVYRLTPNGGQWSATVLHSFTLDGENGDGQSPYAPLIFLRGFLMGTTQGGGLHRIQGAVFQLLP